MKINDIVMTCSACPSQWDAKTEHGEYVYIRYRWGSFRIDINGEQIHNEMIGDGLDGSMTTEEMLEIVEKVKWESRP